MSSIEMDNLSARNSFSILSSRASSGSSTPQTTATNVSRGTSHSCAVHLTPVESIEPALRLSQMGASFVEYHQRFGMHGRSQSSIEADEIAQAMGHRSLGAGGGRRGHSDRGTSWFEIRIFEKLVLVVSIILILATFPASLLLCLRVVRHYERLVVLRMGRIRRTNPAGPGTIFVIPCIDRTEKIDLRIRSYDISSTDIMLSDSVQVRIQAVIWIRVICPMSAVVSTDDYIRSTKKLTIGIIRRFLGYKTLRDVVTHEREFNQDVKEQINQVTLRFGVRIERVELRTIRLEEKFMCSMAIEGTTRAQEMGRSILAQGEADSAPTLVKAATETMGGSTVTGQTALMLRYMHEAMRVSAKSESGITVFPVPIDWDWKTLLQHNAKQRKAWFQTVNDARAKRQAEEKEKSI